MNLRIEDKIKEIEKYLEEMYSIVPSNLREYEKDFKTKAACERYVEKLIEAVVDLGFLMIKEKSLEMPENDLQIFERLSENKVISKELAKSLQNAKGMRNVVAHKYGSIDDKIIFNAITEKMKKDVLEFIKNIKQEANRL